MPSSILGSGSDSDSPLAPPHQLRGPGGLAAGGGRKGAAAADAAALPGEPFHPLAVVYLDRCVRALVGLVRACGRSSGEGSAALRVHSSHSVRRRFACPSTLMRGEQLPAVAPNALAPSSSS